MRARKLNELTHILKRVKAGERSFKPEDHSVASLDQFQSIGKALAYARSEGLLEGCEVSKESSCGELYYNAVYVIGGLSFKGEEYLRQEATIGGWLIKQRTPILKWFFGIVAGLVLAALVSWLVP
jgi:hypothetical protein